MAYQLSIALRVLRPLAKHLRVTVDGKTFEGDVYKRQPVSRTDFFMSTLVTQQAYGRGAEEALARAADTLGEWEQRFSLYAVSYTHLDVYKRQSRMFTRRGMCG